MSTCTAQQIEEKKRQALAKLRAKQNGLSPKHFIPTPNQVSSCPSPHSAQQIEEKKRQALAKLRAKQNIFSPTKVLPPPLISNPTDYSKSVINRINNASSADMENKVSDPFKARNAGGKMASSIADDKHTFQPYQKSTRVPTEPCNNFYGEVRLNITMSLVSEQMFSVEQSKYYEPLITVFKQIPSKVYGKSRSFVPFIPVCFDLAGISVWPWFDLAGIAVWAGELTLSLHRIRGLQGVDLLEYHDHPQRS